jgi:membrane protease YdiL (CAAX protease family)
MSKAREGEQGEPRSVLGRLRPWARELFSEPTVILCAASFVLVVSHYQGSTAYFRVVFDNRFDAHPAFLVMTYGWWFFSSVFLYMLLPLLISFATRGSFTRAYGLGLGDWRAGLKVSALFLLVMLPAVYFVQKTQSFAGQYPLAGPGAYTLNFPGPQAKLSVLLFVIYELGYVMYFIGWEFLFRGWMVNGLLPYFGRAGAILIPVAPFAVMHLGKAEPEAIGSIVASIALAMLALRTRSFWYGVVVHGAVAVWMDILCVAPAFK